MLPGLKGKEGVPDTGYISVAITVAALAYLAGHCDLMAVTTSHKTSPSACLFGGDWKHGGAEPV